MTETTARSTPERAHFTSLLRPCESRLLSQARRLTKGDDDRAQDLVQDALVKAYEAFRTGAFRAGFSPCAWLARILTNHFINGWRRERRWDAGMTVEALTAGGELGPPQTHAPGSDRPDEALLAGTLDEALERALAALPEALRLTVVLVDVEEYSYAEAATLLDIPIGTVRSRLARARFQLQGSLTEFSRERGLR
jgi:RNA polymerase sigma-70 factor (ECF subfamily)